MASRSRYKRWGYNAIRTLCRLTGVLGFGLRIYGRERTRLTGPALICANHQSHFDPLIVGLALDFRINTLARKDLWNYRGLRYIIDYLDAIPIERDGMALAGIKETLKRMRQQESVMLFPEGTRTRNGEVAPLKPGFTTLARRAAVPLIPIGFDGAYQAWPRTQKLPGFAQVVVVIGEPLHPLQYADMDDAALVAEVERRIRACHAQARHHRLSKYR